MVVHMATARCSASIWASGRSSRSFNSRARPDSRRRFLAKGLKGTTGVTFNGVAATKFTVESETYMTAVVPAGATTGNVVVTTPTGVLTSSVSFRVSE